MDPIVESEAISNAAMIGCLIVVALALGVPWGPKAIRTRARCALVFTTVASFLFLAAQLTMPSAYNIRLDILFFTPLLVLAWIQFLTLWIATRRKVQPGGAGGLCEARPASL
jgi:hypothetical protein